MKRKAIFFGRKGDGDELHGDSYWLIPGSLCGALSLKWSKDGIVVNMKDSGHQVYILDGDSRISIGNSACLHQWHDDGVDYKLQIVTKAKLVVEVSIRFTSDPFLWNEFKKHIDNQAEVLLSEIEEIESEIIDTVVKSDNYEKAFGKLQTTLFHLENLSDNGKLSRVQYTTIAKRWNILAYHLGVALCPTEDTDPQTKILVMSHIKKCMLQKFPLSL